MKKYISIIIFLIVIAAVISLSAYDKGKKNVVGYLDGQAVKVQDLQNYADTLLGKTYAKKLETADGRIEMFNNYVNRTLVLDEAKRTIKEDTPFLTEHKMGKVDEDTALITALLKKEVNDKVKYSKEELQDFFMKSGKYKTMIEADNALIAQKRIEIFQKYMADLRSRHKIEIAG